VSEILVVDDNAEFAKAASDLVAARTGLDATYVTDPDIAIRVAQTTRIAVLVLDERMPKMAGTELYRKVKEIRGEVRVIMLTGEANADEVGQALHLGYHDHLPKGRISDLPERVAIQYTRYLAARDGDLPHHGVIIWPSTWLARCFRRQRVRQLSCIELATNFVDEQSWSTTLQIHAGEERKLAYHRTNLRARRVEHDSQRALKSVLSLRPSKFKGVLDAVIEGSVSSRNLSAVEHSLETVESSERTISLPLEPQSDAPSGSAVRSRHFQQAPVYRRLLVTIEVTCKACSGSTRLPMIVLEETGLFDTRHKDYLADGATVTVSTGLISALAANP
jgi:CheY-like chemotaxis protein